MPKKPKNFFVGAGATWLDWRDRTVAVFGPPFPEEKDHLFALLQTGRIAQFSFTERIEAAPGWKDVVFAEVEDDRLVSHEEFMHRFGKLTKFNGNQPGQ